MPETLLRATSARLGDPSFYLSSEFQPLLEELRRDDPVHWTQAWPDRGFWSVTRYRDIREVFSNPAVFSSQQAGSIIPADPHMYDRPEDRAAGGIGYVPAFMDPPRHDDIRKVVGKRFTGAAVARLSAQVRRICDEAVNEVIERGQCEFVSDVAAKIPMNVICQLMDAPRSDWEFLRKYVNSFICNTDPAFQLGDTPGRTLQIAQRVLFDYVRQLVQDHRTGTGDDITTLIAGALVDGKPLEEQEAFWWVWTILVAGFETSRNVISGGLLALMDHPEHMQSLRNEPNQSRDAAEELTRWVSPSHSVFRVAIQDAQLAGRMVRAGDWVVLWLISANRDDSIFPRPFALDLGRRPNPHMGFGNGIHNCLGRHIALLEIEQGINAVLARLEQLEVSGPLSRSAATTAVGLSKMPIRFRTRQ
jgi:cholest-4-en-3-one 26-monooxygenase